VALALVGCGSTTDSEGDTADRFADGGTFTMALPGDPGNLDPHFTSLAVAGQVDRFLYDSLVNIDASGQLVAGLAEEFQASTTKATYTLRKGVTCADGTALTATQVAENISFVGDAKNASTRIGVYVPAGTTATADDTTGVVTVTSPSPDAFLGRNVGGLPIVCAKGMKDRTLLKQGADGTGMFTVSEVVAGDHLTLTRRKDYAWGPGDWKADQPGLPDKVVIRIVSNETTTVNLVLSGEVNAARLIGPDAQRLKGNGIEKREFFAPFGEMMFNQKSGLPTADLAVRRALIQAVDLGELRQVLTSGTGQAPTGLVAPAAAPCKEDTVGSNLPAVDVAAAKAALDAAGWRAGPGGVRAKGGAKLALTFFYVPSRGPGAQATAELVERRWREIGVDVTLRGVTDAEVGQIAAGQGTWDAGLITIGVTLPTQLVPFVSGPTPPKGANFASIDNPEYVSNVQAASAVAGSEGCARWAAAESALIKNLDLVPFANASIPYYVRGAVAELAEGDIAPTSVRMLG
jgi:peptide/nickel transport system substrate-binding protein